MNALLAPAERLPATEILLTSGGGSRILPDGAAGVSRYGCRSRPDPDLVALGSCTASTVSVEGFAAAERLRLDCLRALRHRSDHGVYRDEAERLREELLSLCEAKPGDGIAAVLAASGTDLHLLSALWLKPDRIVMVAPEETGSGVPAALEGRHFDSRGADGGSVPLGETLGTFAPQRLSLSPRNPDGSLRNPEDVDGEYAERVSAAVRAGKRVLLVVTDTTKTGLIVPSIGIAQELQNRWPGQVEVLVDACQFRLASATVNAYLRQGWLVAMTGSKFLGGPTFCGALLIPESISRRHRDTVLDGAAGSYSGQADWPEGWKPAEALPATANFGLLLRWEAALTEQRAFAALVDQDISAFLHRFAQAVRTRMDRHGCFEELPVHPLDRRPLVAGNRWDGLQTLFPLIPRGSTRQRLSEVESQSLYRNLLQAGRTGRGRFQFGQPVACGERAGRTVSALRLCVGARMLVAACRDGRADSVIAAAESALDAMADRLRRC